MSTIVPLVLKDRRVIAPNTLHMAFEPVEAIGLPFTPGHFVSLHFEHQGEAVRRSYSIATKTPTPQDNRVLEIAISYVDGGKASEFFFNAELGATLGMSGPFGLLVLPETLAERTFLVATGTGVAPYRAMLPRLAEELRAHPEKQVTLLYGCRTRAERLYAEEFEQFAAEHENFRYISCISREEPAQPSERKGYVQHQLEQLSPNPDSDMYFLCGNPAMVDDVFAVLKEKGFGVKNVRREKYVFSAK